MREHEARSWNASTRTASQVGCQLQSSFRTGLESVNLHGKVGWTGWLARTGSQPGDRGRR